MDLRISMRSICCFVVLVLLCTYQVQGQTAPGFYYVVFKDKQGTPYDLSYPQAFLSSKSIDRRIRLGISLLEEDLPVNPQYIQSVLALTGGSLHHTSKWFNSITLNLTSLDSLEQLNAVDSIAALSFVQEVKRFVVINSTQKAKRNVETDEIRSIGLNVPSQNGYGLGFHQLNMVNTVLLHEAGFKGQSIDVGIFDSGWLGADQMRAFSHIREEGRLVKTRDFVSPLAPNVFDKSAHGTYVWGIMAGVMQDQFMGAAPLANYYLFQTEDVDSEYRIEEDNWVAAAELADSLGLDVINSSLGYSLFDDTTMNYEYTDMDGQVSRASIAAEKLSKKGVIVVNSAGNSGNSPWYFITAPADAEDILTVGAVDSLAKVAGFSSHGPTYDGRIKPNVSAMGVKTYYPFSDDKVGKGNGTSYSSPIIAGSVASLLSALKDYSPAAVRNTIEKTASLFPTYNFDLGYGIPDFWWAYHLLIENASLPSTQLDCIFPNPAKDVINVKTKGSPVLSLRITNALGQPVSNIEWTSSWIKNYVQLNIAQLPSGTYFLTIQTEEGKSTSPFEKIDE